MDTGKDLSLAEVSSVVLKVLQHRLFEDIGFEEMNKELLRPSYTSLLSYITKVCGYVRVRQNWNDSYVTKKERIDLEAFQEILNALYKKVYAAFIGSPEKDYQMTTLNETQPEKSENADILEITTCLIEKLSAGGHFSEVKDKTTIALPIKMPLVQAVKVFCGFEPVNDEVSNRLAKYSIEFSTQREILEIKLRDASDACNSMTSVVDPRMQKQYAEGLYSSIYELLWLCPDAFLVNSHNGFYEALHCKLASREMYYAPIDVPVPKDGSYGFCEGTPNTERLKVCAFKTPDQPTTVSCIYGETTHLVYAVVTAQSGRPTTAVVLVDCAVFKKAFSSYAVTQVKNFAMLIDSSVAGYTWLHSWNLKLFNRGNVSGTAYPDEDIPRLLAARLYDAIHKG